MSMNPGGLLGLDPGQLSRWGQTLLALLLLVAATAVLFRLLGIHRIWAPALAITRAFVQLAVLSLILRGILTDLRWTFFWLLVMAGVAVWTSGRRIGLQRPDWPTLAVAIVVGVAVTLLVVFGLGGLQPTSQNVLAFGGIITGNTMTISTLTGRGFHSRTIQGHDEIEAWFALGALPRQATRRFAYESAAGALLPSVDQTKTTGLVTLPGAFVGALFGGASPVEAGRFQLIVLAGILFAGSIAALILLHGISDMKQLPVVPNTSGT